MKFIQIVAAGVVVLSFAVVTLVAGQRSKTLSDEEILAWEAPADVRAKYPYYLSGYDNEGSPVYVWEYGKWDFRSAAEGSKSASETLERVIAQMVLRWKEDGVRAPGKAGTVVIADAEGFNLRQATHVGVVRFLVGAFKKMADINRTPGGIKRFYNVNTNYLIKHLFRISRRHLGSAANVTELYEPANQQWRVTLLKTIEMDQLPEKYGGFEDHQPVKVF